MTISTLGRIIRTIQTEKMTDYITHTQSTMDEDADNILVSHIGFS
jgi:hypothetical protein